MQIHAQTLPLASAHKNPTRPAKALKEELLDTVAESVEDFGHHGKKLGSLAAVSWAASQLPLLALTAGISVIPSAIFAPVGIGLMIAALPLAVLEEKHLGIGKKVGHAVGSGIGAVVGLAKGGARMLMGKNEAAPARIELKQQSAGNSPAFRPLAQRAIDAVLPQTRKERSKTVEVGEVVGATASTLAVAYTVPGLIGAAIGGPLGAVLGTTLIGPLTGMVLGGLVESTVGVGRAAGELAGRLVEKLRGPKPKGEVRTPADRPATPGKPGLLKQGFFAFNSLVGQPLIGFLLDTTMAGNRLLAQEPHQSMTFRQRPVASVDKDRLIEGFVSLAGINGPSGAEGPVADELAKRLGALDISFERRKDNTLIATLPASPGYEDSPTVMLSAHQDTVSPTSLENIVVGERRIHTNERTILGADDRAGLAQILEAVQSVQEQGLSHPEVKLVFTVDEERGLLGASRLKSEDISSRPTLGYVVDALDVRDLHLTNDAVIVNPNSVKYNYSMDDPLVQVAFQSMANAGVKPRPIPAPIMTGAGSDANTRAFNSGPIRSMAVGVGERDLHTPLEYIKIKDLEQGARHVVGLITHPCDLTVEKGEIRSRFAAPLKH